MAVMFKCDIQEDFPELIFKSWIFIIFHKRFHYLYNNTY